MQSHPNNPKLRKAATPGLNGSQVWSCCSHLPASGLWSCKESYLSIPPARALCLSLLLTAMGQQTVQHKGSHHVSPICYSINITKYVT